MEQSIFTKIIKGEIPCHKLYEDEQTLAFLDIHPVQPGHTLVIPKKQVDKLYDLDDATYQAVMETSKKLAAHLDKTLGKRVGFKVVGVDVPHAHVQLIPFGEASEFHGEQDTAAEPDHEALAAIAKRLRLE
jgi:histidine triad (HIT) family protein